MKYAVLFLLLNAVSAFAGGEPRTPAGARPWPGVAFAEVRAYAWPVNKTAGDLVSNDLTLQPDVINKEGAVLTAEEVKQLQAAITGRHPTYPLAFCFDPHNAVVFYNAEKKPVAYAEVCFSCWGIRASPKGTATYFDHQALAVIFDAHKLPMGPFANLQEYKHRYKLK
jgi:hypothetical protein